ncbi:hypothetical protein VLF92_07335 [Pseudomonas chengduensis]
MNLRILKKLSKRAAPLLAAIGDGRKQFPAERGEDYTSCRGHDRKHWERNRYPNPSHWEGDIHVKPRSGQGIIVLSLRHICPWPGTVMVGWSSGYYEPEWEEEDAWTLLAQDVRDHWTDYRELPPVTIDDMDFPDYEIAILRRFRNPSQILKAAHELVELRSKGAA